MIPREDFIAGKASYEIDEKLYQRFPVRKQAFVTLPSATPGWLLRPSRWRNLSVSSVTTLFHV